MSLQGQNTFWKVKAKRWELSRMPMEPGYILDFQFHLVPCKVDLVLRVRHWAEAASPALCLLSSDAHKSPFRMQSVLSKVEWKQKTNFQNTVSAPFPD